MRAALLLLALGHAAAACVDVSVDIGDAGAFPEEVSWTLGDATAAPVQSSGSACLAAGAHTLVAYDAFGDGWDNTTLTVAGQAVPLAGAEFAAYSLPITVHANDTIQLHTGSGSVTDTAAVSLGLLAFASREATTLSTATLSVTLGQTLAANHVLQLSLGDAFCEATADLSPTPVRLVGIPGSVSVGINGTDAAVITLTRAGDGAAVAAGAKVAIEFGPLLVPAEPADAELVGAGAIDVGPVTAGVLTWTAAAADDDDSLAVADLSAADNWDRQRAPDGAQQLLVADAAGSTLFVDAGELSAHSLVASGSANLVVAGTGVLLHLGGGAVDSCAGRAEPALAVGAATVFATAGEPSQPVAVAVSNDTTSLAVLSDNATISGAVAVAADLTEFTVTPAHAGTTMLTVVANNGYRDAVALVALSVNDSLPESYAAWAAAADPVVVAEDAGSVTLQLQRTGADLQLPGTVRVYDDGGALDELVAWGAGDSADKSVVLPIADDDDADGNRTVRVFIDTVSRMRYGAPRELRVLVVDDDQSCYDVAVDLSDAGAYPEEVSWTLGDSMTTAAQTSGSACLAPGEHAFVGYDAYGDGWDSAVVSVAGVALNAVGSSIAEFTYPVTVFNNGSVRVGSRSITSTAGVTRGLVSFASRQATTSATATMSVDMPYELPENTNIILALGDAFCTDVAALSTAPIRTINIDASAVSVQFDTGTPTGLVFAYSGPAIAQGTKVTIEFGPVVVPATDFSPTLLAYFGVGLPLNHALTAGPVDPGVLTYTGGDGNMGDATLWDRSVVPDAAQTLVVANGAQVTVEADAEAHSLVVERGLVTTAAELHLSADPVSCASLAEPTLAVGASTVYASVGFESQAVAVTVSNDTTSLAVLSANETISGVATVAADMASFTVTPVHAGTTTLSVVANNGYHDAIELVLLSVNETFGPSDVAWAAPTVAADEGDGWVSLQLTRTGDDLQATTSVRVYTDEAASTATAGTDYTAAEQVVTWGPGDDTPFGWSVQILDDAAFEADNESVVVVIEPRAYATVVGAAAAEIVIVGPNDAGGAEEDLGPVVESATVSDTAWTMTLVFDRPVYCNWTLCPSSAACDVDAIVADVEHEWLNCTWTANDTVVFAHAAAAELPADLDIRSGYLFSSPEGVISTAGATALDQRAPAPELVAAAFGNSGAYIFVDFDAAAHDDSPACDALFEDAGDLTACVWVSSTQLRLGLDEDATIVPGSCALTLLDGAVRPVEGSVLSAAGGCVDVAAPAQPPTPVVVFDAPAEIGNCDGVVVDVSGSTGSAGRDMTIAWTVEALSAAANETIGNVTALVASASDADSVTLSSAVLPIGGEWRFTVSLTNFLNPTPSVASFVLAKRDTALPVVRVSGGTAQQSLRYIWLFLSATAQTSACEAWADGLEFSWASADGEVALEPSEDPRAVAVAPFEMESRRSYDFVVTAWRSSNPAQNSSATVSVYVQQSPVVARIRGGDRTGLASDRALVLTAAEDRVFQDGTSDPDREDDVPFSYEWAAAVGSVSAAGDEFVVPAGQSEPLVVTVNASKADGRWDTASVTLAWAAEPEPDVLSVDVRARSPRPKFSADEQLTLLGNITTRDNLPTEFEWTAFQGSAQIANLETLLATPLDRAYIVVAPGMLAEGLAYTFRLTAGETFADLSVEINSPPTSGELSVTPVWGTTLETVFVVNAREWTDDAEDLPLSYYFEGLSAAFSSAHKLSTTLPRGNLTVVGLVSDALGAVAETNGVDVVVEDLVAYGAAGFFDTLGNASDSLFAAARDTSDGEASFNVGGAVGAVLAGLCEETCGEGGECVDEACQCTVAGYEGESCDSLWSEWGDWGACSVACGGGEQTRSRTCLASAACTSGAAWEAQACNEGACSGADEVDGGWGEWGAWSDDCDCAAGGVQTRARGCDSPTPTPGGAACEGDALETQSCADQCLRGCPADCSGHGACAREPATCSLADPVCESLACVCDAGWHGEACRYDDATWEGVVASRETVLVELAEASARVATSGSLLLQAETLAALTAAPSQLSTAALNATATAVDGLLARHAAVDAAEGEALAQALSSVALSGGGLAVDNATETLARALVHDAYPGAAPAAVTTPAFALVASRDSLALMGAVSAATADGFETTVAPGSALAGLAVAGSSQGGAVQVFDDADLGVVAWAVGTARRVTALELTDPGAGGAEVDVSGLEAPVVYSAPLAYLGAAAEAACVYWDKEAGAWTDGGLVILGVTETEVVCGTTHFTDFSSEAAAAVPEANLVHPIDDASLLADYANADNFLALGILCFVFFFFTAHGVYFWVKDRDLRRRMQESARERFVAKGDPLARPRIDVHNVRETYPRALQARHAYLGLYRPAPELHAALSRTERSFVLLCSIMVALAVAATFYGKSNVTLGQRIAVFLISLVFSLIPTAVFPGLLMSLNVPGRSSTNPAPEHIDLPLYRRLAMRNKRHGKKSMLNALGRLRPGLGMITGFYHRAVRVVGSGGGSVVPLGSTSDAKDKSPRLVQVSPRGEGEAAGAGGPPLRAGSSLSKVAVSGEAHHAAAAEDPTPTQESQEDDFVLVRLPWYHGAQRKARLALMSLLVVTILGCALALVAWGVAALQFPFLGARAMGMAATCVVVVLCVVAAVHMLGSLRRNELRHLPPRVLLLAALVAVPGLMAGCYNPVGGEPAALRDAMAEEWRSGDYGEACADWEAAHGCCGFADAADKPASDCADLDLAGCEASLMDEFADREAVPGHALAVAWLALVVGLPLVLLLRFRPDQHLTVRRSPLLRSLLARRLYRLAVPVYVEWRDQQRARRRAEAEAWVAAAPARQHMRRVTYAMMAFLTLLATYFCLVFGIRFGSSDAADWLLSSIQTVATDVLLMQPIKCFAVALVMDSVFVVIDVVLIVGKGVAARAFFAV